MAAWVGKSAFELILVYDALMPNLKRSTKTFIDGSPAPALAPGANAPKTGNLWALVRDDRPWTGDVPPGAAFTYSPGRFGQHANDILQGFSGTLQVDGYAGYSRLLKRSAQDGTLAYCWTHVRRKLQDVTQSGAAPIAQEGLAQIQTLYRTEKLCAVDQPTDDALHDRNAQNPSSMPSPLARPKPCTCLGQDAHRKGSEIHRKILGWTDPVS